MTTKDLCDQPQIVGISWLASVVIAVIVVLVLGSVLQLSTLNTIIQVLRSLKRGRRCHQSKLDLCFA